jgi:hypothetical protein
MTTVAILMQYAELCRTDKRWKVYTVPYRKTETKGQTYVKTERVCIDTWPRKPINFATCYPGRQILNDLKDRERRMCYSWDKRCGRQVGSPALYFEAPGSNPTPETGHPDWRFSCSPFIPPTGYGLNDRMIGLRFSAGAGNFSLQHHVRTGSGAHPASYPMGNRGSFPGGKAAGAWSWPHLI